ncbi:MAG TPA: DUF2520 domain-containing protein [Candidatus Polarisedimenticolaceae bacterium]
MKRAKKPAIAVIGSGRAATAVLAHAARRRIRSVPLAEAEFVVLAVSDRAIGVVARRLAREVPTGWAGKTAIHLSGALGPEPLEPLRRRGARVGALHPLTVFAHEPSPRGPRWHRLDGDAPFRRAARALAKALFPDSEELRPRRPLGPEGRARYHAAAALVANDLAALIRDGVTLFRSVGLPRARAEQALGDLASDATHAIVEGGLRRGLTGPVVRGDVGTVERHLEALREVDPEIAEVHRVLSLRLVPIAVEARRITASQAAALRSVLRPPGGGPRRGRGV